MKKKELKSLLNDYIGLVEEAIVGLQIKDAEIKLLESQLELQDKAIIRKDKQIEGLEISLADQVANNMRDE